MYVRMLLFFPSNLAQEKLIRKYQCNKSDKGYRISFNCHNTHLTFIRKHPLILESWYFRNKSYFVHPARRKLSKKYFVLFHSVLFTSQKLCRFVAFYRWCLLSNSLSLAISFVFFFIRLNSEVTLNKQREQTFKVQ